MDMQARAERFQAALDRFVERVQDDRNILAVVLIGSIRQELMWCRDHLTLWVIEVDGVTARRASDGEEHRIFRILAEDDLDVHAELIPRTRFKRMVEGSARTAFTHSFFAVRRLVWSRDASIERWFDDANSLATRDQRHEILTTGTWVLSAYRDARRTLDLKDDVDLAAGGVVHCAWALAALAVVQAGVVYEDNILYWARDRDPGLYAVIYDDVLARRTVATPRAAVEAGLAAVAGRIEAEAEGWLGPLVDYVRGQGRIVALSEICDHWAHSQLYPWHLEIGLEWLARRGRVEKVAAPFRLTKRSRVEVEEPAYQWVA